MPDLYIDESHFHRDLDLGYTWVTLGRPWASPLGVRVIAIVRNQSKRQRPHWASRLCLCPATVLTSTRAHWAPEGYGNGCAKTSHNCIVIRPCGRSLLLARILSIASILILSKSLRVFGLNSISIQSSKNYCFLTDFTLGQSLACFGLPGFCR